MQQRLRCYDRLMAEDSESRRLAALHKLRVLDSEPEATFERVVSIVTAVLEVPIAMITLVDSERCWYKAEIGLGRSEMPRSENMCDAVIRQDAVFVVNDATLAPPELVGPMLRLGVRFYIGAPFRTADGVKVGTLCAVDTRAREVTDREQEVIAALAAIVGEELELRLVAGRLVQAEDEMRRLNHRLATANQNKSDFLTSMSHELRAPLNGILGACELLAGGGLGRLHQKQVEYVRDIQTSGVHLLSLINDLLDLSSIEAGRIALNPEQMGATAFMDECAVMVRGLAAARSLDLRVIAPDEPLVLCADERRLKQVACNLLGNALKFAPQRSVVAFSAAREGSTAVFAVEDQGPGVPLEFQERIFDQFFRMPGEQDGYGLGLPLARRLVELQGGRVWLQSGPESGSRFCFSVPLILPA